MGSLLTFIVFAIIIYRIIKKSGSGARNTRPVQNPQMNTQMNPPQSRVVTDADRERLNNYRQRKGMVQQTMMRQAANPDIVERAKNNTAKYQADTTKEQLELEHGHSESMKTTGAKEYAAARKEAHPHDAAHVAKALDMQDGELLDTVENLMVKGFDGNLSFERDFVGEGMDMINSFSIPRTELDSIL